LTVQSWIAIHMNNDSCAMKVASSQRVLQQKSVRGTKFREPFLQNFFKAYNCGAVNRTKNLSQQYKKIFNES